MNEMLARSLAAWETQMTKARERGREIEAAGTTQQHSHTENQTKKNKNEWTNHNRKAPYTGPTVSVQFPTKMQTNSNNN